MRPTAREGYPDRGRHDDEGVGASTLDLAITAAAAAGSKKAQDTVLLDMRSLVTYTDWLVVCTGQTPRQTKAIADEVRRRVKEEHGTSARRIEGEREGEWVLIDLLDVVVHVFTPGARDFYRLDRLWREAPHQTMEEAAAL